MGNVPSVQVNVRTRAELRHGQWNQPHIQRRIAVAAELRWRPRTIIGATASVLSVTMYAHTLDGLTDVVRFVAIYAHTAGLTDIVRFADTDVRTRAEQQRVRRKQRVADAESHTDLKIRTTTREV